MATRRKDAPVEAPDESSNSYDIVLTDAFRVEDALPSNAPNARDRLDAGGEPGRPSATEPPQLRSATPPKSERERVERVPTPVDISGLSAAPAGSPHRPISVPSEPPLAAPVEPAPSAGDSLGGTDDTMRVTDDALAGLSVGPIETQLDLARLIPPDADPVWARDAVLSFVEHSARAQRTKTEGAWFSELFRKEYLLAHPVRSDRVTEAEVNYIERALSVAPGGRVFDLCSGYGRHAVAFARRGYEMVGLDLSIDLLQRALDRAQAAALSIKFVHGDMRDLNFDEVFDGAYSVDTSFGYFSEVENLSVLNGIFRSLKRGGRLVLDVVNRDYIISDVPNRKWWEGDGCLVQEDIEFDLKTSRLKVKRYLVFSDGKERVYDISLRVYGLHELYRMLDLVGFSVQEVSGSLHSAGAYFGACSPQIIITAQKD